MQTYNVSRLPSMIKIGYDGENNWRPQAFDCTPLLQNHPNGTISLWLLPHGETQAFPVALTRYGDSVVWTPLSEEMTAATGALQLVCTDGTDVGKSAVVMFRVDESILPGADHPAAVPSWATQTIERAEDAADRAEAAAESIDIDAIEAMIAQAIEDYLIEHPIEAPVQSVNGKTGAVTLGASDVGALPADTPIPAAVTVDSALSSTSENPVQNKVINAALQSKQDAPLEIHVTESEGTYSTTATAEQIRAAKENSVFVIDGEARIKALLWLHFDEGVDLLIGMQTLNSTIMSVAATVSADRVSIAVEQTPVPVLATDLDMEDWDSGKTVDAAVLKNGVQYIERTIEGKADASDIPTAVSELTNDSGYQTAAQVQTAISAATGTLQTKAITDTGNYFTTDTVDGALQEIGAELAGVNTLIGSGVIT